MCVPRSLKEPNRSLISSPQRRDSVGSRVQGSAGVPVLAPKGDGYMGLRRPGVSYTPAVACPKAGETTTNLSLILVGHSPHPSRRT